MISFDKRLYHKTDSSTIVAGLHYSVTRPNAINRIGFDETGPIDSNAPVKLIQLDKFIRLKQFVLEYI